jgi:archaeal flagellin FlaB
MDIGVLIIFIATILMSAVAAGVMIKSTGLLQERALLVEDATRQRLVNGVEVFNVMAEGNITNQSVDGFEFYTRLRAGSTPVQMRTLGLSAVTDAASTSATLNESLIGSGCQLANLTSESEFCFDNKLGNNDTVLSDGELLVIKYRLAAQHAPGIDQNIEITFLPQGGSLETLTMKTPNIITNSNIRIR